MDACINVNVQAKGMSVKLMRPLLIGVCGNGNCVFNERVRSYSPVSNFVLATRII